MSAPDSNGLLMAHPYGAVILIVLFLGGDGLSEPALA